MTRLPRLIALAITLAAILILLAVTPARSAPRHGLLAYADAIHGPAYLAVPEGRGHWVRLCGAGGCLVARSNDQGPTVAMRQAGRVGDLGVRLWEFVCGVPRSRGLCEVTIEVGVELE